MESDFIAIEEVTKSDLLRSLNSWDTPRTREQLLGFIASREEAIFSAEE